MRKIYLFLILIALVSSSAFCITTDITINAYKVDRSEGHAAYFYAKVLDPNSNDMTVVQSSNVDISARGASGDGIVAFTWILYGDIYKAVSVSIDVGPMTYIDGEDVSHYIPFSMTFECGNTMISHFTVPYNSASPIESASFTTRENNKTYKFKYSDYITKMATNGGAGSAVASLANAKATLTWTVNPSTGQHTSNQSFDVTYNMSSKSVVSVNNNVINNANQYPSMCNQWNRSGTAYIKLDIDANAEFRVNNTTYTATSGIYRSTVTVTCTGV